jgi:hypothetical protein
MTAAKCSYKTAVSTTQNCVNNGKLLLSWPCPHIVFPVSIKRVSLNLDPRTIIKI